MAYNVLSPTPSQSERIWAATVCYVTFDTTFSGTNSLSYRVRDNEGRVSETARATLTVFEN